MSDSATQLPMNSLDAALAVLLAHFNVKPSDAPPIGDTTEQWLDSALHPHGIMRRKVARGAASPWCGRLFIR